MPITHHLGISARSYRAGCLTVAAPLAENINHKGTAFAGSLNAAATLAGWGLVWLLLREAGLTAHVVIQDSTTRYLRPVSRDFCARCCRPSPERVERFLEALRRRGRARLELEVEIAERGVPAVAFSGRYVAQTA